MSEPTSQDHERARKIIVGVNVTWGIPAPAQELFQQRIAFALAKQRRRDSEAVEAAGDKHADLIGEEVPQRMAHIAALYLRSGYDAEAIRREK